MTMLKIIATIFVYILANPAHATTDVHSGNFYIDGCIDAIEKPTTGNTTAVGYCYGAVNAMLFMGPGLGPKRFCPPDSTTSGQAVRVVNVYLAKNPARLHEAFYILVADAFREVWPCK